MDTEEEEWFDVFVRRPDDSNAHNQQHNQLPEPTETFTSTYQNIGEDYDDITLVFKGYRFDSEQTLMSTGVTAWEASDHLCNYFLCKHSHIRLVNSRRRILELGSGLGQCGLLLHQLRKDFRSHDVLTDGDINALHLLRMNVALNTPSNEESISTHQLIWGKAEAKAFLSRLTYNSKFDMIIGSDLLYTNKSSIDPLFETVDELLQRDHVQGRFILVHNEKHLIPIEKVIAAAVKKELFCEVLSQKEHIYILCFRPPNIRVVNNTIENLQNEITKLKNENHILKVDKEYFEEKCMRLDERCTVLRGDEGLPKSILLSFEEDNLAYILSFLELEDFSSLASTCKLFGTKVHVIGGVHVSLIKKLSYKLYEGASSSEKEALPVYEEGISPFFLYDELLELRKPLKFDRFFGGGMQYAIDDKSTIQPRFWSRKTSPPDEFERRFNAYTAVSDYVMRTGKHYVTFTCSQEVIGDPLWFGVVRPLQENYSYIKGGNFFTPFDSYAAPRMKRLRNCEWGDSNIDSCVYSSTTGQCQWTYWGDHDNEDSDEEEESSEDEERTDSFSTEDWKGMQTFEGGTLGLLLDYDKGTLTVFKNGIELGILTDGLSGTYSWMVTVGRWFKSSEGNEAWIKIERLRMLYCNI